MSSEQDTTSFQFHAPGKGTYLLDLFSAAYPSLEQCKKEDPIKYVNICRFKLNCHGIDKVFEIFHNTFEVSNTMKFQANVPLPDCAPGEWGPSKGVKLVGLVPLSHMYPVINAAPARNVSLREEKPLTLNMEFEMTRPLLDFVIRLHKNGERPYDEVA